MPYPDQWSQAHYVSGVDEGAAADHDVGVGHRRQGGEPGLGEGHVAIDYPVVIILAAETSLGLEFSVRLHKRYIARSHFFPMLLELLSLSPSR